MDGDYQNVMNFMNHICIKYGVCLPKKCRNSIANNGPYSANEISRILLKYEGLDPDIEIRLFRCIRNEYIEFTK